jgi:hypothetical protein
MNLPTLNLAPCGEARGTMEVLVGMCDANQELQVMVLAPLLLLTHRAAQYTGNGIHLKTFLHIPVSELSEAGTVCKQLIPLTYKYYR